MQNKAGSLIIMALLIIASLVQASPLESLFLETNNARMNNATTIDVTDASRYRMAPIKPGFLQKADGSPALEIGDQFLLNLFTDATDTVIIDKIFNYLPGIYTVRARVPGKELTLLFLTFSGEKLIGMYTTPEEGREYRINSDEANGMCCIKQMRLDARDVLEDAPALISPDEQNLQFENEARSEDNNDYLSPPQVDADEFTTIDIMIVYTPAAKYWAAGSGGIGAVISQAMSLSQTAFDDSNIKIILNLVLDREIGYKESNSSYKDLQYLTYHAGFDPAKFEETNSYMDDVHVWRDAYHADVVALLTDCYDVGGISWVMTRVNGWPEYGFFIARVQQAGNSYTLVHEMGHNMGAAHRKDQACGCGMFSYSHGWRWIGQNNRRYCSVMSYTDSWNGNEVSQVGHFSNPEITHASTPTGHVTDGDNARGLNQIRTVIAGYRVDDNQSTDFTQITGMVRNAAHHGVDNCTVEFSNGGGSTITNYQGQYTKYVPYKWSGTATPVKEGWIFNPIIRSYNRVTSDLTSQHFTGYRQTDIVKVLSPNGDENWKQGEKHIISWTGSFTDNFVYIDLYNDETFVLRLNSTGTTNDGNETWDIGYDIPAGSQYKIRITGTKSNDYGESDQFFTIREMVNPDPPVLLSPANGAMNVSAMPRLEWNHLTSAVYILQISTDPAFNTLLLEDSTLQTAHYNVPAWILPTNTTCYWRVITTIDGESSNWPDAFQFQTAAAIDPEQLFISNLEPAQYQAVYLDENEKYYTDRDYQVTILADTLQKLLWIRTANDDKNNILASKITFQLLTGATIYVAYDNRATAPPDWLKNAFKPTSSIVNVNDEFGYFNLWKKHASPGQISLGGNMAHGAKNSKTNYVVLLKPDEIPAAITLLSPNGGETWYKGSTQTISWSNIGTIDNVKIELYKAGAPAGVIQESTVNDDSLAWTLPDTLIAGDDYTVRITAVERDTVWDESNAPFTIADVPQITVTSPNGGESWQKGSTQTITWNSIGNIGDEVKIDLYKNGALTGVIQESTVNDDSLTWTLPDTLIAGDDYTIRITAVERDTVWDESNAPFTVADVPQITVLTPNGSETWLKGSTQTITWNSIGNVGDEVKIDLYKNGTLRSVIRETTANDDSLAWIVPDSLIAANDYKLRITAVAYDTVWDESDSPFIITDIPQITVLTPNGGETWLKGSTQTITWNSAGNVGDEVKIDLLKNGILTNVIQETTANDDSLAWIVTLNLASGNDYAIKITALANSDWFDCSDDNFTIQNPVPARVNLLTPVNRAIITSQTPQFSWSEAEYATTYQLQAATDTLFTAPLLNVETDSSHYTPTENLAAGQYYWRALAKNESGASDWSSIFALRIESTGILDYNTQVIPDQFYLAQNYPNPFNPVTTIQCGMPKAGHVEVRVINLSGQLIDVLVSRYLPPGTATLTWNAAKFPSGVYYYVMTANGFREVKKMLLVK